MSDKIASIIQASIDVKSTLLQDKALLDAIAQAVAVITDAFRAGKKVLFCGNGGSAADAQHLAAEFSGRFYIDRDALPAEALHVNTSYTTAVANDYSYDVIYSRLIDAMGKPGDVLIGLSTSGNSKNVVKALERANALGLVTAAFTGETGGEMKHLAKYLINIPSIDTPRIQECHMILGHTICELVELKLFPKK